MRRLLIALVAVGGCVFGAQLSAHHSFEATYIEDQAVTIEGELVQLLFRNPHSFVQLTVMEHLEGETLAQDDWPQILERVLASDTS